MPKKPDEAALDAAIIETVKRISQSLETLSADTERSRSQRARITTAAQAAPKAIQP
jgi:hypothetical protein